MLRRSGRPWKLCQRDRWRQASVLGCLIFRLCAGSSCRSITRQIPRPIRANGVHGARIDERFVFSDSTDMLRASAIGLGAALARERIVAPWLASGQLVRLPGEAMPGRYAYHIVYPAHRRPRPAVRRVIDWLAAQPVESVAFTHPRR